MHPSVLFVAFAAAASAIDIHLQEGACAGSNNIACRGINPDTCCSNSGRAFSQIAFRAIPREWRLEIRGHSPGGNGCGAVKQRVTFSGATDRCLTGGPFTGGGYSLRNGAAVADNAYSVEGQCKAWKKPDTLTFFDGPQYDIYNMEEVPLNELLAIAETGANSSAVPAHLHQYLVV